MMVTLARRYARPRNSLSLSRDEAKGHDFPIWASRRAEWGGFDRFRRHQILPSTKCLGFLLFSLLLSRISYSTKRGRERIEGETN